MSDVSPRTVVLPAPIVPVMISNDSVSPPSLFNHFMVSELVRWSNSQTDPLPTVMNPLIYIYITLKKTATNLWRRPTLRRERGAPGDAGIRPVTCGKQWDLLTARIDAATREAIANLVEERPQHGGYTSTYDHHFRFKQVHDVANPQRQEFDGLLQSRGGERITGGVGLADYFTGDGVNVPVSEVKNARAVSRLCSKFCACSSGDRPSGCENLDAAPLATSAARTAVINAEVATFGARAGAPVINAAIHHNAGPNPRAYAHEKAIKITTSTPPYSL